MQVDSKENKLCVRVSKTLESTLKLGIIKKNYIKKKKYIKKKRKPKKQKVL